MGCGSCGGNVSPKIVQRVTSTSKTPQPKQIRAITPPSSMKVVRTNNNTKLRTPTVMKAKSRADGTKSCTICGGVVKMVLSGTGKRKRLTCSSCGHQFSK